jgi:hypothetical protein
MAYDFPNSPAFNDTYGRYKWDGEKWILIVGGRAAPVPSYANPGGTGNRTSSITVTSSSGMIAVGSISELVNGAFTNSLFWYGGISNNYITFDFGVGAAKRIDEFKWYQTYVASHGIWVFEGSNDGSSYTTFPGSFDLGSVGPPQTVAVTNTNYYRYYRLRQTSGGTNTGPYEHEIEFRII